MTTVEKLNNLISIKQDIKTAIENKGVDMTGVSFLGYASKIGEIVSGVGYTDRDVIEGRYQYNISNSASFVYSSAFEYKSVQTVDLPNCLYVGNRAFFYCTRLTTVNLPTCNTLYEYAFRSCNNLSSISLPNVNNLSAYCLANCTALETISLPKCSYLNRYAFWSCSNLNTIYMGTGLSTVASMAQSNALLDCSALQSIYVPASLVDKYKSATNWSYYSSIIYPFGGPEPTEYYIKWTPSSAEGQFNIDGTTYDLSAFGGLYYWSTGVINSNAFKNNYSIQSIETNATSIGSYVFKSCSSLSQASLSMCSYIGDAAFLGCSSLSRVSLPICSHIDGIVFKSCNSLSQISLPKCSYIGDYAFKSCNSLSQISLPMCSYIGGYAFQSCSSLSQISLPKCSYIGSHTFKSCSSLKQVNLPMCSYIGSLAFETCSSLSQVSLPMCSYIRYSTFYYCKSLKQVSLPICEYIENFAFNSCYSLSQISLPMCSYIGEGVFYNCSSLSIITIGYSGICSLDGIGAFDGTKITSSKGSIYVPASLVDKYKSATNWSYFSAIIQSYPGL